MTGQALAEVRAKLDSSPNRSQPPGLGDYRAELGTAARFLTRLGFPGQAEAAPIELSRTVWAFPVVGAALRRTLVPCLLTTLTTMAAFLSLAASPMAVIYKHSHASLPELPNSLRVFQPLIDTMMAKEPQDRCQSAEELLALVKRALA